MEKKMVEDDEEKENCFDRFAREKNVKNDPVMDGVFKFHVVMQTFVYLYVIVQNKRI